MSRMKSTNKFVMDLLSDFEFIMETVCWIPYSAASPTDKYRALKHLRWMRKYIVKGNSIRYDNLNLKKIRKLQKRKRNG